jgi:hypothetical protein
MPSLETYHYAAVIYLHNTLMNLAWRKLNAATAPSGIMPKRSGNYGGYGAEFAHSKIML